MVDIYETFSSKEIGFYTWPEATPLQSTTDPNETVRLHRLCTVCQHLVDDINRFIHDPHDDLPNRQTNNHAIECKHYRSSLELADSSERGCHLCSILWNRLQAETSSLESLRLLESHLQAASIGILDMVPHSYALRIFRSLHPVDDLALILYYPPKYFEFSESEERFSLLKSYLKNKDMTDIAQIDMNTIPSEDFPQRDDFATVSTASESSFALARGWLRDCRANHRLCNHISDVDFAPPTRVIDVGMRDAKLLPRLYLSSTKDVNMEYVALSHCWGRTKPAILKKHLLRTMTRSINWHRLPKTFQDAILVTRRLGYRYLWIDSLCIMQDSREDWIQESGNMQNVYANCVLTIAASWGKGSGAGLFINRKPLNQQPCRVFRNGCAGLYVQPKLTDVSKTARVFNPESLEKRAWAFQERVLPARVLSYRSFELQWDCLESHGSESWPTGLRRRAERLEAQGLRRYLQYGPQNTDLREISLLKARSGRFDPNLMRNFYSHWDDILQKYSQAELTFRSDVLIAFSGITKTIEKWTCLTNIFGMWKELLPVDLLWIRMSRGVKATRSLLCPTWSWASLVDTKVGMSTELMVNFLSSTDVFGKEYSEAIQARVIPLEQHSAASESYTKIKIQGPMFCTKVLPPKSARSGSTLEGVGDSSLVVLDSLEDYMFNENIFCLLIIERKKQGLISVGIERVGLILACREREKEDYVRIGVWSQSVFTKDEAERMHLSPEAYSIITKEEDLALNAEEKTIFLF